MQHHELVMKAVRHHDKTPWILLHIERWLKAPVQQPLLQTALTDWGFVITMMKVKPAP